MFGLLNFSLSVLSCFYFPIVVVNNLLFLLNYRFGTTISFPEETELILLFLMTGVAFLSGV